VTDARFQNFDFYRHVSRRRGSSRLQAAFTNLDCQEVKLSC
jgi:hypothetical protein